MAARCKLEMAFSSAVAGVFTLSSALDGPDVLADVSLSDGTFTDISGDAQDPYQVVFGTDSLMSAIQAASLSVTVARIDDPGYWNPNNPASPLAGSLPGLTAMRPVRLTETLNGTPYPVFTGYSARGTWDSDSLSCLLYCEDFLLWASRVYPIFATGPTTMGELFKMLVLSVDPTLTPIADRGIDLPAMVFDGSQSVTQILASLLPVDLGTVFVMRDGTPVYRQADYALSQDPAATVTITEQASVERGGFDVASFYTRATVNGVTAIDAAAELDYGRADNPEITSALVSNSAGLAQELVQRGGAANKPVGFTLADVDDTTLALMLNSLPLSVYTVDDPYAGTTGDVIAQRLEHTISAAWHELAFSCLSRPERAFTLSSALDGPDVIRWP